MSLSDRSVQASIGDDRLLLVIYYLIMSCWKDSSINNAMMNSSCTLSSVILVFYIYDTKIVHPRPHKQFTALDHTSFSIHVTPYISSIIIFCKRITGWILRFTSCVLKSFRDFIPLGNIPVHLLFNNVRVPYNYDQLFSSSNFYLHRYRVSSSVNFIPGQFRVVYHVGDLWSRHVLVHHGRKAHILTESSNICVI